MSCLIRTWIYYRIGPEAIGIDTVHRFMFKKAPKIFRCQMFVFHTKIIKNEIYFDTQNLTPALTKCVPPNICDI